MLEDGKEPGDTPPETIGIPISQKIVLQGIYKAFIKYFVSLSGNNLRADLLQICEWLRGEHEYTGQLPQIAVRFAPSLFTAEPWAICYHRIVDDSMLPKHVIEFHFLMFVYVVIVPFVESSEKIFCTPENYEYFWNHMVHWGRMPGWKFMRFDSTTETKLNFDFRMVQVDDQKPS